MPRVEELKALVDRNKASGYVLFDDIEKLLPRTHNGGSELEEALLAIEAAALEILDEPRADFAAHVAIDPSPEKDLENPINMYMREIARFPPIDRVQEFELTELMRSGDAASAGRALQELVQANLLLVVAIAKRYGRGVKLLDLAVAGNNGLMDAMRNFDCHRGYRFSSYAIWWIRQAIIRASRTH